MKTYWLLLDGDEGYTPYDSEDEALSEIQNLIEEGDFTSDMKLVKVTEEYKIKIKLEKSN